MNCDELLAMLNEYIDASPDPGLSREFEEFSRHLRGCEACQIVVDNIRNTIQVYKQGREHEVPPDLSTRLYAAIQRKWQAKQTDRE